jgi:predicted dienelactone hydrolase
LTTGLVGTLAIALVTGAAPVAQATATDRGAGSGVAITLPEPTGPYPTGTTRIHLRDPNRVDPLDHSGAAPAGQSTQQRQREVMAQLWYPAKASNDKPLAAYAPPGEAAGLQATYPVPAGAFTATTHSRVGAPIRSGVHKVVFFHHGLCASRTDTTVVNEQLASMGFVVVALANTHESPAVEFPGGRVETTSDPAFCLAGGDPFSAPNQAILQRLLSVRVADVRFTLDKLDQINRGGNPSADGAPLPRGIARSLDTRRVGIFGHSFGGGTAAAVMREDRRFVAGVNLDGFVIGPVATEGLRKPFLVLGSSYHEPGQDQSWDTFLPALDGWRRWFRLTDAGHYRFIDLGGSVRKWGLEAQIKPNDPETWRLVFGDIDDALSLQIVTRLVTAFFQQFLLHRPQRILDRPSAYYPQIEDRTGLIR